jgi:hypothetical protein
MYVHRVAALALACAAVSHTNLAGAQTSAPSAVDLQLWQPPASPSPEPRRVLDWYGYQLLAADATALTLFFVGLPKSAINGEDSPLATTVATTGALLYTAGGPVIHALHHRPRTAVASLLVRIGAPLALGLFGAGYSATTGRWNEGDQAPWVIGGILGAGLGTIAALVIDDVFLSVRPAPSRE